MFPIMTVKHMETHMTQPLRGLEALCAENDALRARIVALDTEHARLQQQVNELAMQYAIASNQVLYHEIEQRRRERFYKAMLDIPKLQAIQDRWHDGATVFYSSANDPQGYWMHVPDADGDTDVIYLGQDYDAAEQCLKDVEGNA
jgi:hypothetical protein